MTSKTHTHKLRRKNYKTTGTAVFYCIDNCDYKIGVEFALGKLTRCNICNNTFAMNEYSIRAAKPRCMDCVKRKTLSSLEVTDANNLDGIRTVNRILANTAEDRVTSLKEQLEKTTTIIKEYNPDDEENEL
jgi:transcription initiation factor IIE alpha subunit